MACKCVEHLAESTKVISNEQRNPTCNMGIHEKEG